METGADDEAVAATAAVLVVAALLLLLLLLGPRELLTPRGRGTGRGVTPAKTDVVLVTASPAPVPREPPKRPPPTDDEEGAGREWAALDK